LLFVCLAGLLAGNAHADDDSPYLKAVREFADNVLKYGRDTYGPKHTPLFVDGLNIHTHEPVKWIAPNGDRWILSNLASQQNLFRTLDGLSTVTGDPKYKQAAMDAIKYAFENLRSPNGLFYWGQVTAYNAGADDIIYGLRIRGEDIHGLKLHYPYYELMWEVNSEETKRFIEAFWSAHILDWSNLDMNRYALLREALEEPWNHQYKGGPTFFKSKQSDASAAIYTGTSLVHAGTTLYRLSGQEQPLIWSKRLAERYVDTRHPNTGISYENYNNRFPQLGDDLKEHFNNPQTTYFPYYSFDLNMPYYYPENVQAYPWMSMLLTGKMLGEEGKELTRWALEEFTAWGKSSYRKKDNCFVPILTDGTKLEGYVWKEAPGTGPDGLVVKPWPVGMPFFWAYSIVYSATGDDFMWQMVRDIALGNGFGDIGETPAQAVQLQIETNCSSVYGLLGFLELYARTDKPAYLEMAQRIADNVLLNQFHRGFFVPSRKHIYTRFDCFEPLALLHLYAAIKHKTGSVPRVWPSVPLFVPPYRHNRDQGVDRILIYTLTESSEPPLSLREAAIIGDVNLVRTLIENGTDVDSFDDAFLKTALHQAAMRGQKEVVELLLAKGAEVNARDRGCYTPLHYASQRGHKEITELLIAKGSNVNAQNKAGDTPLDVALSQNHKEIADLLIQKGADVSLHTAAQHGLLEKLKELISKGTDVNAKNNAGETALEVAIQEYHQDIVRLLIDKGAEVSINVAAFIGDVDKVKDFIKGGGSVDTADTSGQTLLHYATAGNHKDIAELLISKGANVNAFASRRRWMTPLGVAARTGSVDAAEYLIANGANVNGREGYWTPLQEAAYYSKEMVELLIAKGANINAGKWTALHSALDAERFDIVELLLDKGADVNIRDGQGRTPFHIAAWYAASENPKIVELLLSKGADINAKDNNGKTALSWAIENGYTEIVELLRKHGAKKVKQTVPSAFSLEYEDKTAPRATQLAADVIFSGEAIGDGFGDYTDFGKDVNGDGHNDIIVGSPRSDSLRGRASLFYGGPNMDNKPDIIFNGEKVGNGFGVGVVLGDINGDEYNDVIIGEVLYNSGRGRVYVYYGGTDMDTKPDKIFEGQDPEGQDPNSWFGRWQSLDDINGDKCPDLIVSALHWDSERGRVYVFHGSPSGAMDTVCDMIFDGENRGDAFGRQTAAGKDVNGDGYPDLVIGAEYWPKKSESRRGRAYLYHGGPNMDSKPDMIFTGELSRHGARFGNAVELCDVDNDGSADVIIGDPYFGSFRGRTYLFFGGPRMDNIADKIFSLGDDIVCGDMNEDGYNDIVLGNSIYWNRTGIVYVYHGGPGRSIDQIPDKVFKGEMQISRFGVNVKMADLNNNGFNDLLVGAWGYNSDQGRVYLYYGGPDK